jgi:GT2 family glycosyltransferase
MNLSVVVTIVEGGDALAACLLALANQHDAPPLEVIVPWDESVSDVAALAIRFPIVRFLALGHVPTAKPVTSAAGAHELFDRRRAAGLAAATGEIVAILEDRGVPRSDWAATMIKLHRELPHAVVGGAIENGRDTLLHWAVYFCDFGRYQRPFLAGTREWVSDVNIAYKRRALDATRAIWRERYHETSVHWALQRAGEELYLSPEAAVDQMRGQFPMRTLLSERYAWGRLFAYTRARESSAARRIMLAALTPLLPFVLLLRHGGLQFEKRVRFRTFLAAAPMVFLLLVAWGAGEAAGYLTAKS